jgi:hypothetical protein
MESDTASSIDLNARMIPPLHSLTEVVEAQLKPNTAINRGSTHAREIVITVTPDKRARRYRPYLEPEQHELCVSHQPFLDCARKLLARGHDPRTMLVMRWVGAENWALRGSLGVAAKLAVDEHNGTFAKWKPLSRSAVRPRIAKSADQVLGVRPAEKSARGCTAEKVMRVPGDAPEACWDAVAQYLIEASE